MLDAKTVKETLARLCRKPVERIKDEMLMTEIVAESFALVEIVIELQEELSVRLVSDDMKGVKTVADFVRVVVGKGAAQAPPA